MQTAVQNNIASILAKNPIIPVVTINKLEEIDGIVHALLEKNIHCIEVTLRTTIAFEAIQVIKEKYASELSVGVGTVISSAQIQMAKQVGVDFIVSPGISKELAQELMDSKIPFIPGVATPSDIILGLQMGWNFFKFFPANLFGGLPALKTYQLVFPNVVFCPTGGINETTYPDYLALENVQSVGGSWMIK
jgi:2-dehydro-3-deoxyphosphogluconate aldolase/(4S)-4-hydroxy-2-oxoglutarate aldolase